jgi:prophage antirepressor-like protein
MSNPIQNFEFQSRILRVEVDEDGNPWFMAKDVCDILGYANSRKAVSDHCNVSGVTNRYISYESGQKSATFINEGNLYRLIIKSSKPEAEPFEAWVCDEVLPSIRKHGYYVNPNAPKKSQADLFDDMPPELPPFQRVKPSLLIKLGKMSKALAQAYLVECGVTPDYVQQQLGTLGDAAPMLGIKSSETADSLASRFVADWQAQVIPAPFMPCLGEQALRLFHIWLQRNGQAQTVGDNHLMAALYRHPSLYGKRTRIAKGGHNSARQVLMVSGESHPVGMGFIEWIAECVSRMDEALQRFDV